jgi:hypothetical protein
MDLIQRKLSKSEWETIEVPVSPNEIEVLKLIMKGNENVNIKYNKINSIFTFLKIEYSSAMEDYIFNKYLADKIKILITKYRATYIILSINTKPVLKKADLIRISKNTTENLEKNNIYEYVLLEHIEKTLKYASQNTSKMEFHYYTLYKLIRNSVPLLNRHIIEIVNTILTHLEPSISITNIVENAVDYIEKNNNLLKYGDMMLYEHQKEIFTVCKNPDAKLILYIAPTGTGKTLTPIGLSEQHKIIFVCAARHVGLALARAAISVNKKVAFAFGCSSAADIRLHYFAAKEFTKNKRSGGIWKVDNSVGDKVEIIICDIKSYLPAMYYMLSFNSPSSLITYWDEPTITLDYPEHPFHAIIKENWSSNLIPNMVLSSATLPKLHELTETVNDFTMKFSASNSTVYNIVSHDCKKTIPIIDKNGNVILPHFLSEDYDEMKLIVEHCENYLTLLRYFDLKEVVRFISFIQKGNYVSARHSISRNFGSIDDIDMKNIKLYYLKLLKNIISGTWSSIYLTLKNTREKRIVSNDTIDSKGIRKSRSIGPGIMTTTVSHESCSSKYAGQTLSRMSSDILPHMRETNSGNCGIFVTTKDAYTLTDGPTIFLSNDVEKIAKFCIQQANIPAKVMSDIMEKIEFNNRINDKISVLEKDLEDHDASKTKEEEGDGEKKDHKCNRSQNNESQVEAGKIKTQLDMLRSMIKTATLNETFIPNKNLHLKKWAEDCNVTGAFSSNIEEEFINEIMLLTGVADSWKVLLLMGIGVFTNHENIAYTEIMKKMADEQNLYIIIASSDYIYGTNYQFCHGYISKDLDLTQEKIIQAMGRIGRNNLQQNYSVRFRDDEQIMKLFTSNTEKPEIINMNRLFNSAL